MVFVINQDALILDIGEDGLIAVNVNAGNMGGLAGKLLKLAYIRSANLRHRCFVIIQET